MTIAPSPGTTFREDGGFKDYLLQAAESLDVQPLAVEKDYWVCEALRAITAAYPDNIVFKGGTSLEKLRIIQRFSEDLDLLVVGDLGQAGGPNPHAVHSVTSLLSTQLAAAGLDVSPWTDLASFEIAILHPGRTLIEKLLRVNNFVSRLVDQQGLHGWPRVGRQFYDIWALLGNASVQALLADKAKVSDILDSIHEVSRAYRGDEPVPSGGFAASSAFDPTSSLTARLQREHDAAIQSLYYGDVTAAPTFGAVLDRIHQHADLLRVV